MAACRRAGENPGSTQGNAAAWIEALVAALGDPEKAVVRCACDALATIETRSGGTLAALEAALGAPAPGARFAAAFTLARIRPPGPELVPSLMEALSARDSDVRWAACRLLVETSRSHPEVYARLGRMVQGEASPALRRMAAFALRELGSQAPGSADALLAACDDGDVHVRRAALHALSSQPPEAPVAGRLLRALGDADGGSRRIAALSLGGVGSRSPLDQRAEIRQALEACLDGVDRSLVRAAERALSQLDALAAANTGAPPQPDDTEDDTQHGRDDGDERGTRAHDAHDAIDAIDEDGERDG